MNAFTKAATQPAATLENLTLGWIMAKQQEVEANARRIQIEQQIAALLPPPQGGEGVHGTLVGDYKVTVKYGVTRKVNVELLQNMWATLPESAQKCFRWKADVDTKNLRGLREFAPGEYGALAEIIETKPAKPSVLVDMIEKEAA